MIINKYTDIIKFMDLSEKCPNRFMDDFCYYCQVNNKCCDQDFCPLLKKSMDIDHFQEKIERLKKEYND